MRILIVDDNPQIRQLIRSLVKDLAEEVIECGDGDEAVAVYAAQKFSGDDRVLMDLQMPRLGGLEATRRLLTDFPEARIIIVTQHDDPYWSEAAQLAGACGYVLKENLLDLRLLLQTDAG